MANEIPNITGVILAGGTSSRMGSNKALLPYQGRRLIENVYGHLAAVFTEVLVVTNAPQQYRFLPCMKVKDVFAGGGALAGIHAGLCQSGSPAVFVVACDMPYLNEAFIRHLASKAASVDVVIPRGPAGLEPLHAVYGRGCLAAMEASLIRGEKKISSFFGETTVEIVTEEHITTFDPEFKSFRNINTPMDYYRLRAERHSESPFFKHVQRYDSDSCSLTFFNLI
ncbi:molybdenum cofactor guanylyltransferase [Geotalea toluenoxydans]|uniref:molybdenum cofactor guanylyltransferase n=1 Tax=Geotalea toluenoxydans TaxID=421624 RepID=UPI0006D0C4FC|nr:molybdenum cofactor guanylyltransferase [Geotalea toluenoxydans]